MRVLPVNPLSPPSVLGRTRTPPAPAPPLATPPAGFLPSDAAALHNPLRKLALLAAPLYLFVKIGYVHEVVAMTLGFSIYAVWLLGLPAITLSLASGAWARTMRSPASLAWFCFLVWLFVAAPFSSWRSDSLRAALAYLQITFPILILAGGTPLLWQEYRRFACAIGLSVIPSIIMGRSFARSDETRMALEIGSIGNSNDYAAHILFVVPFVVFIILTSRQKLVQLFFLLPLVYGLYLAAQSGSRGAMLAAAAGVLMILLRGPSRFRLAVLALLPVLLISVVFLLPSGILARYASTFQNRQSEVIDEATESIRARRYLLEKSLELTLRHPLFGVGANQFPNVEGSEAKAKGFNGHWQVTHNSYTQVSSETGLPGLLIYLAAMFFTWQSTQRVYRLRRRPEPSAKNYSTAAFCLQLSLVTFGFSIIFLSLAYAPYLLLLTGLAVSLERLALAEFSPAPSRPRPTVVPPPLRPHEFRR